MNDTSSHASPQLVLGDNNVWPLRLDPGEGGGWLLVDAGFDAPVGEVSTWEVLIEQALGAGVIPDDVRVVVVTHEHVDHAGLAARWARLGARIVVGRAGMRTMALGLEANERLRAARTEEFRRHGMPEGVIEAVRGVHPTRALRWEACPEDALDAAEDHPTFRLADGRTLRLIPASGHTPGNLVALIEESRELFSGDTLIPTTIPTSGLHFPGLIEGSEAVEEARRWPSLPPFLRSVAAIRELGVTRVFPGHGDVIDEPAVYLDRFEAHHARRAEKVRAALAALPGAGEATAFEVVRAVFRRLPDERLGQAMTEVLGHLDLLAERRAVEAVEGAGISVRWKLTGAER